MKVNVQKNLMSKNDVLAVETRQQLAELGIYCINIIGSPGSGKTTLLENTCARLQTAVRVAVIEGDIATSLDAERIAKHGVSVHQINTQGACHLDAAMVQEAMSHFDLSQVDLLIVENVGNLVCPAGFDLGEDAKVVVLSVPEGDDKPAKYPNTFRRADACVISKTDLLFGSDFDMQATIATLSDINAEMAVFPLSARSTAGLDAWCEWLISQTKNKMAIRTTEQVITQSR